MDEPYYGCSQLNPIRRYFKCQETAMIWTTAQEMKTQETTARTEARITARTMARTEARITVRTKARTVAEIPAETAARTAKITTDGMTA